MPIWYQPLHLNAPSLAGIWHWALQDHREPVWPQLHQGCGLNNAGNVTCRLHQHRPVRHWPPAQSLLWGHRHRWELPSEWLRRAPQPWSVQPNTTQHEIQTDLSYRLYREEVRLMDRRLHPGLSGLLPADVGEQAGVRGVRQVTSGQKVSVKKMWHKSKDNQFFFFCLFFYWLKWKWMNVYVKSLKTTLELHRTFYSCIDVAEIQSTTENINIISIILKVFWIMKK